MLEVTPNHAVYVDGVFMAASSACVDGEMSMADGQRVTITSITHATGAIINPITASGTILAGPAGAAVLAGTVDFWAHNVCMRLVALPGPWNLVSGLVPSAFQASPFVETAFTRSAVMAALEAMAAAGVPFPIMAAACGVYDVVVCALFMAGHAAQLVGAVAALALGVAVVKATTPGRAKAGAAAVRT
ncbi:hypothetical protein FOA52_000874 [Chlamydomonas sp. UWO 241]|nr:hypothetical protein FOA52_000874 [Chlamydomonas sp. UWO 241]